MAASVGPHLPIGTFEASSEVGPFYSRFDARPGKPDLSAAERRGQEQFNGEDPCALLRISRTAIKSTGGNPSAWGHLHHFIDGWQTPASGSRSSHSSRGLPAETRGPLSTQGGILLCCRGWGTRPQKLQLFVRELELA
jgi:hypothetical protein